MVADANRRGYRHLLDSFWDEARSFHLPLPTDEPVSAPAFANARHKITPEALRFLVHEAASAFDAEFGHTSRWHGRRLFAVDGSRVNVQRGDDLAHAFGVPAGAHCPQVLVSTLFDVVSKVPHDITVAPSASCERQELVALLDHLDPGDVLVLDRGYPSFEILHILRAKGIDFVMRVPARNSFGAIEDFLAADTDDARIVIQPPSNSLIKDAGPFEARALRVQWTEADPTILITSLRRADFTRSQVAQIYRLRWEIEEFYKLVKAPYLSQGQFHAKSAQGVRQEIHAVALFVAITRYLIAAASGEHAIPYHHISRKSAVLGFGAYVVRLLLPGTPDAIHSFLEQLLRRIIRTRDPRRPHRSFPRRSFQPARKWGPQGRRGG